jgi:hypothetical protein
MSVEYRLHVQARVIPGRRNRPAGEQTVTLRLHDAAQADPLREEPNMPVCADLRPAQARELAARLVGLACWAERLDSEQAAGR